MQITEGRLLEALAEHRLILLADKRVPSVAGLVAGEPIHGSWWGHPAAHAIFAAANRLAEQPVVLVCKLLSGKVTFVHQSLWPEVLSIAVSRSPWQLAALSEGADALLREADGRGQVQAAGRPVAELERRLLVHVTEVHTGRGSHAKLLNSWKTWLDACTHPLPDVTLAQQRLERLVIELNSRFGADLHLPWL